MERLDLSPPLSPNIVLVKWEHEPILWVEQQSKTRALVCLAQQDVISGSFFPPQVFYDKLKKLRILVDQCAKGELTYAFLLARLGFSQDERLNFSEIEYKY